MTNEDYCKAGICCDCFGAMRKWTHEEIAAAKDDLGMDDSDDFCDCCEACNERYLPARKSATLRLVK